MTSNKDGSKGKKVIYLLTTILITAAFLITGIGNIIPFAHIAHDMSHLGYPPYFPKILGVWKILAAAVVAFPVQQRFKEWAYAGMILDLTGAAFSRFSMGDGLQLVIVPLMIAGLVTFNYVLRNNLLSKRVGSYLVGETVGSKS